MKYQKFTPSGGKNIGIRKSEFVTKTQFLWIIFKHSLGTFEVHTKFGPDRFSRFDVYWIQTDRHPDRQTDKQSINIDRYRTYRKDSETMNILFDVGDIKNVLSSS